jgi:tetratricopeptide (TPR) repeat protein
MTQDRDRFYNEMTLQPRGGATGLQRQCSETNDRGGFMQVVSTWTGRRARLLQQAFCMTNEAFADHVSMSPRMIAYWHKRPDMMPATKTQRLLDGTLENADARVKAKFAALLEETQPTMGTTLFAAEQSHSTRLDADEQDRIHQAIHSPKRLDATAVINLKQSLVGQRHADDILGPDLIIDAMSQQRDVLEALLRNSPSPHRDDLGVLVADWTTFVGWLHTELGEYAEAEPYFAKAEQLADEIGNGILASTATSYRGYLALLQGNHRAAIRQTMAAIATPGAHLAQHAYDHFQAAQAYAGLGDTSESQRLLHRASEIATIAGTPPQSVYWYTEPFFRLNIGLTQHSIGEHQAAADSIRSGLADLPADQQQAEWLTEYHRALEQSEASGPG